MKKFLFLLMIFAGLVACRKYTTPNNVKKVLSRDTWKVARMVNFNKNITDSLDDLRMSFANDFGLRVSARDTSYVGTWEIPSNDKCPAELYINLPATHFRAQPLSDDWYVIYRTKEELHLERLNGKNGASDVCILRKS